MDENDTTQCLQALQLPPKCNITLGTTTAQSSSPKGRSFEHMNEVLYRNEAVITYETQVASSDCERDHHDRVHHVQNAQKQGRERSSPVRHNHFHNPASTDLRLDVDCPPC